MDTATLNRWRAVIKQLLADLSAIPIPEVVKLESKTVFDESSDNYMVVMEGWAGVKRLHGCGVPANRLIDGDPEHRFH